MKVSPEILKLVPYKPGKPISETKRELGLDKVVKLASNENPLGPSPRVIDAVTQALKETHLYPDATFYELRQGMSNYYRISAENLTFGNGSNELIDLLIRIFCEPGDAIVTSEAAFIAYKVCGQAARVRTMESPLDAELKTDLRKLADLVESEQRARLVFVPNPNNPTGTYSTVSEMTKFLQRSQAWEDTIVVVDEAYLEFVRAKDYFNAQEVLANHPNLVILRTLSKVYGLAGFRVGVLLADKEIVDLVDRVRNPFNVNSLAQVAALAAIGDQDYLDRAKNVNWSGLDYFYRELEAMGIRYWPSQGNFVLFDTGKDSEEVFRALLQEGLILRPVKGYGLPTHLRMSVGLAEENEFAIDCLKKVLR